MDYDKVLAFTKSLRFVSSFIENSHDCTVVALHESLTLAMT